MSNTIRTDRDGVKRKEGLHKKQKVNVCDCAWCRSVEKKKLIEEISEKEIENFKNNLHN
jgi:hypothetical protein